MSKSIQLKNSQNEKMYPNPYYPVGSIYLSVNDTNPSTWFGGTWQQIAKGRTLVGVDTNDTDFNTVQKTGGSKAMQKHTHTRGTMDITGTFSFNDDSSNAGVDASASGTGAFTGVNGGGYGSDVANSGGGWVIGKGFNFKASNNWTGATSEAGTGTSGNLQPYFTCYIWCRTA